MMPTVPTRVLLTAAAVVGGIGLLDAAESGDLDFVALFGLLLALHVLLLSRLHGDGSTCRWHACRRAPPVRRRRRSRSRGHDSGGLSVL